MRPRLFILALSAGMVVFGACGFDRKGVETSAPTTEAPATDTRSADTGSSDTASSDTSSFSDTGLSDTSTFSDTFSDSSSSDFPTTSTTPSTSTTSSTGGLGGYSDIFKRSFVDGCAGTDPAKRTPCQCVIDKVSQTIPYDDFLKNITSPQVLQIIKDCRLGG